MLVKLNEIIIKIDINYEAGINYALKNTTLDYDELEIKTEFYEIKENTIIENKDGIVSLSRNCRDLPENELSNEIIKANKI